MSLKFRKCTFFSSDRSQSVQIQPFKFVPLRLLPWTSLIISWKKFQYQWLTSLIFSQSWSSTLSLRLPLLPPSPTTSLQLYITHQILWLLSGPRHSPGQGPFPGYPSGPRQNNLSLSFSQPGLYSRSIHVLFKTNKQEET